jgi:hypothetical protein
MNVAEYLKDGYAGDVVRIHHDAWPKEVYIEGPVYLSTCGELGLGGGIILERWASHIDKFAVISRAPRPLYNNHPRSKPHPGDVVTDGDGDVWLRDNWGSWHSASSNWSGEGFNRNNGGKLTLVFDGEKREVVK